MFTRVATAAAPDMPQGMRLVVAVDGLDRGALATMCTRGVVTTVLVTVAALERAGTDDVLARLLAHELAHAALGHRLDVDVAQELEADRRAAVYVQRAGYDCARGGWATVNAWAAGRAADPAGYRAAVAAACTAAR